MWEAALADEILTAERAGIDLGRSHGVQFTTMLPADQKRFDALYNDYAGRSARASPASARTACRCSRPRSG